MKFSKAIYKANKDMGYFPYFQLILKTRIKRRKAVNVVVTGEAGEGKSYLAWTLCLLLDPKFSVDQIVFTYAEYMRLLRNLGMGRVIMFDEPSYAMGKRDWYKQINKVLVQTIESQRFKVHPLFIPIINKALLDKTIREHLIQFQVSVKDRGRADVYRLQASQFEEKVYHHFLCELRYPLITQCEKPSCLGCRQLKTCPEFRAAYERKKAHVQNRRYKQAEIEAERLESKEFTVPQLGKLAYSLKADITDDNGKINVKRMRMLLMRRIRLHISIGKGYDIKEWLLLEHPDEFTQDV